jgi:CRISPR-associated protein Csy2
MRNLLLISRIKVQNANALSSPFTIGFPAMTAWLGAVHALQRQLNQTRWPDIVFKKTAICCHQFDLQTYKGSRDFVHSIIGTGNPLDKDGSRSSFIEEARCHLEASLVIEYENFDRRDENLILAEIRNILISAMRIAGGDILSLRNVEFINVDEDDPLKLKKELLHKLMLGHVLIERRDLMQKSMHEENRDALDALLDHLCLTYQSVEGENDYVEWASSRKTSGWIVPIAVGFQGISDLGIAKNQRDLNVSHRFAESVVTLGEFVMPYRIENLDDMMWQYQVDLEKDLYLCQNQKIN